MGDKTSDGRRLTPRHPRPRHPRPRHPRPPRVRPPKLHQPKAHVTAMVGAAALISALAAATPSLQGSFVRGAAAAPVGAVSSEVPAAAGALPADGTVVPGAPSFTTTITPPADTTIGSGAGEIPTVLFPDPGAGGAAGNGGDLASPLASDGIPVTALEAYQHAADTANADHPSCHIPWPLLAGIGRVESDHGRYGGAVLRPDGTSTRPIIGIPLNGNGTEVVSDTDGGSIDGDPVYDRAVGPMQFIPSTWGSYGADGNGDGIKDPFNIFDAALAAADYLCVAGGDLSTTAGQTRAVLTYNHSTAYLDEVLALEHTYASGEPGLIVPSAPVTVPPVPVQHPGGPPVPPPADPGPPLGLPPGSTHHHHHHHGSSPHPSSSAGTHGSSTTSGAGNGPTSSGGGSSTSTSTSASSSTSSSTSSTGSSSSSGSPSTTTSAPDSGGAGPGGGTDGPPTSTTSAPSCPTTSPSTTSAPPDGSLRAQAGSADSTSAQPSPSTDARMSGPSGAAGAKAAATDPSTDSTSAAAPTCDPAH